MGNDGGAARAARTAAAPVPPALAGCGAPGPGPAGPTPAARPVAAHRVDPRLPQPRPGRAGHHHRRPAGTGPRHAARAGRPGDAAVTDPARRRTGARGGVAAAGRTAATRALLADLPEQCWQLLIAPHWPRLRDLLDADLAFRAQTLAGYGLARVLGDVHPRARWTGRAIVIDRAPAPRAR